MTRFAKIALVAAFAFPAGNAFAQSSYGYGMAGCGLGTQLFRNAPGKFNQIIQNITNRMASQTSAVTSGTSGCVESPREMAAVYISINHVALMKDVSRGGGETLANLSGLYECNNSSELANILQKNFDNVFAEGLSAEQTSQKIEEVIINNKVSCDVLS